MLRNLFSLTRFFLFWLLFFAITRLTFELYFLPKLKGAPFTEILQTYWYGLRLDASASAYISALPLLVFLINWFFPKSSVKPIWLKVYVWFCLFCISLNTGLNFNIFREWGTKVVFRVFKSLYDAPSEAFASTGSSPVGKCVAICVALLALGIFLSNKIINYQFKKPAAEPRVKVVITLILLFFNFILIRGGSQPVPVGENSAYFSDHEFLNQAALNTEWNLFNNVVENLRKPYNPFIYMQ
ncbi:MAG TPA: hypothetical protein VIM77_12945, partial [Mucilaginibacter sp.]